MGGSPLGHRYSSRWIAPSPMSETTSPPFAWHSSLLTAGRVESVPPGGAAGAGEGVEPVSFEEELSGEAGPGELAREQPKFKQTNSASREGMCMTGQ